MIRAAYVLALLSLLAISLVPSGYMVAEAEDGTLNVRICSAGGTNQAQVRSDDPDYATYQLLYGDNEEHEDKAAKGCCDMGPSPVGDLGNLPRLTPPTITPAVYRTTNRLILSGIFPAALPPSTGPPRS